MPTHELRTEFRRLLDEWLKDYSSHPASLETLEYSDFRLWLSIEGYADLVRNAWVADGEQRFRRYFREELFCAIARKPRWV
jgi:hypothetical protein